MITRPIVNLNCCPVPGGERGHAWEPIAGFPVGSFARRCVRCGLCFFTEPQVELAKARTTPAPVPVPKADASWTLVKWLAVACLITVLWALKECS